MGNIPTYGDDLLLPEDVLIQILVRVPVISLLRFKSVCKSWRALIQSSFFIDRHTATSSSSSKCGTFIFQNYSLSYIEFAWKSEILMLSSGSGGWYDHDDDDDDQVFRVHNLGFPSCDKFFQRTPHIVMVGSCNGLICMHNSKLRETALWNPATRQFRILPKSLTILEEGSGKFNRGFVAFGFDVKTKDYKVVQIACFRTTDESHWREEYICRVQVYSLSTDSWRFLEGIKSLPALPLQGLIMNNGLYLNGSYFFMGSRIREATQIYSDRLIISFDFTKEIFTTMQFPDHDYRHMLVLSYLGEKMALFTTLKSSSRGDQFRCDYENYDIWVLNEHGGGVNKESWTKLHSFRIKNRGSGDRTIPRGISKNGEFALIQIRCNDAVDKLQLFNLVTKEAKNDFLICSEVLKAEVYKQSLVSIIGGNGATTADRVIGGAM